MDNMRMLKLFKEKSMKVDEIIKSKEKVALENEDLKEELKELKKELFVFKRENSNQKNEVENLKKANVAIKVDLENLRKDSENQKKELKESKQKIDQISAENGDLKNLLTTMEKKSKQKIKSRNIGTQTQGEEKEEKKGFISFFKSKLALKPKAPKKRVKFVKAGKCREETQFYPEKHFLPGFIPYFGQNEEKEPEDFVLPRAPEGIGQKRKLSPKSKSPTKAKKARTETTRSPKKDTKKAKTSQISNQIVPEKIVAPPAKIQHEPKIHHEAKTQHEPQNIPPSVQNEVQKPQPATSKFRKENAFPRNFNNFLFTGEVKTVKRGRSSTEEMIPLGKSFHEGPKRNERSVKSFNLTPEALKAINERKVVQKPVAKPLPPKVKRIADPTQRRPFNPARPSLPSKNVIEKDLEISDDEENLSPTKKCKEKRLRIEDDEEQTLNQVLSSEASNSK